MALASPGYAASLGNAKLVSRDDMSLYLSNAAPSRQVRSLPYGGGSIDSMNSFDPMGPVDAFLDEMLADDSSEDLDEQIAELEEQIAELQSNPTIDAGAVEERVAELQEQIAAVVPEAPPPPEKPAPANPAEVAAEAQEQQQSQQVRGSNPWSGVRVGVFRSVLLVFFILLALFCLFAARLLLFFMLCVKGFVWSV